MYERKKHKRYDNIESVYLLGSKFVFFLEFLDHDLRNNAFSLNVFFILMIMKSHKSKREYLTTTISLIFIYLLNRICIIEII